MNIDLEPLNRPCTCGKSHEITVKGIYIEPGALDRIPLFFRSPTGQQYVHPLIVFDSNTKVAAGEKVQQLLSGCEVIELNSSGLHADETAVAEVLSQLDESCDILLAVGAGSIHDIVRYVAYNKGIPFLSVPTAASVDGFVSTVVALTWHGFKKTLPAVAPLYVFADSLVFSQAPYRLTAAGVSDLLGKHTALADWRIAHVVTDEYICEEICQLEEQALETVTRCLDQIKSGDIDAIEQLMYALLLSGLAMQMVGNSRPASGGEHHLSHLWEMGVINPPTNAYHGEKVSVGLLACLRVYEEIRKSIEEATCQVIPYEGIETDLIKDCIPNPDLQAQMIKENQPDPLAAILPQDLQKNLPAIASILAKLPSRSAMEDLIHKAGGVVTMEQIGLSESILPLSLQLAPYVRNRLTLLRLWKMMDLS